MGQNYSLCVIIWYSLLAHICVGARSMFLYINQVTNSRITIFCVVSFMILLYPLWGHLADAWQTRYRVLVASSVFMSTGLILLVMPGIISVVGGKAIHSNTHSTIYIVMVVINSVGGVVVLIGQGLFESNAIQFGLDQLLESPTEKLITFIRWYYWSQQTAIVLLYYVSTSVFIATSKSVCPTNHQLMTLVLTIIMTIPTIGSLLLIMCSRKHLYIQRSGLNPFHSLYKVLKYTWKHKVPQHRSAFTYWEDDIPPRIDVGKIKYGGPFTNEEVEDTKTFLRILLLLFSIVGFHLTGNGYSAAQQFQQFSCPSIPVLLVIVLNPQHLSSLVAVIGIPLYRMLIRRTFRYLRRVLMLTRMWIGLYLCLVQVIFYLIIALNHNASYWQQHPTGIAAFHPKNNNNVCLKIRFGYEHGTDTANTTCQTADVPIDNTYLLFIIPQLLNGLSSLFVFMTALEFICAQAPRTTQGLLIGVWYAMSSIKYLVIGLLDTLITEKKSWLISEGVKGLLILLSLILFSCLSKHYRYRQRDEIVNVQAMIEDTHDKWMDQEEEYMKERKALLEK